MQLQIDFSAPVAQARAVGEEVADAAASAAERAVPDFCSRAAAVILAVLGKSPVPVSGEELTDACKRAGLVPKDDRAFGGVFQRLSRTTKIRHAGWTLRKKGHGTGGGRLWELAR